MLAEGAQTTAYTYLGEKITWDIYWNGTIGEAKKDLDRKRVAIDALLQPVQGKAQVAGRNLVGRLRPKQRGQRAAGMGPIRLDGQIGQQRARLVAAKSVDGASIDCGSEGSEKVEG